MKIFVINLERSTDRRKRIESQLRRYSLDYEFVSAIDYRSDVAVVEAFYRLLKQNAPTAWMSRGQAACTLSHYKAYGRIVDLGVDGGIILEDDAFIDKHFRDIVHSAECFTGASIALISYYQSEGQPVVLSPHSFRETGSFSLHECVELNKVGSGMGYYVSKRAAEILFTLQFPRAADDWSVAARIIGDVPIYAVYPPILYAEAFESTIDYAAHHGGIRAQLARLIRSLPMGHLVLREVVNSRRRRSRQTVMFSPS